MNGWRNMKSEYDKGLFHGGLSAILGMIFGLVVVFLVKYYFL